MGRLVRSAVPGLRRGSSLFFTPLASRFTKLTPNTRADGGH